MKKKKAAILLTALMLATSLTACGKNGKEQAASGPDAPKQAQDEAVQEQIPDGKTVEIEFWYGFGGKQAEILEEIIADFNASQDEVAVTGVSHSSYNETNQMLQAAIASGDVPACYLSDPVAAARFAQRGLLQYLDDYIAADATFDKEDIIDVFLDYCRDEEGRVYSLPVWGSTQVIYYRKDMFEEVLPSGRMWRRPPVNCRSTIKTCRDSTDLSLCTEPIA